MAVKTAAVSGAWTTYHHDDARTGFDPTQAPVTSASAGWVSPTLDGQIYGEPLIYNGLVYVATLNNTVYALDQASGTVAWSTNFGAPQTSGWLCDAINTVGIVSTPVIDVVAGRIYAVAFLHSDLSYHLFGLDLATGAISEQTVFAPAGFDWTLQIQRGALALSLDRSRVYVTFGGRQDCGDYHGYVVGVPTDGSSQIVVYRNGSTTTGIWAPGGPVVDDTTGKVFVSTGNGGDCIFVDQNDAVVRLSASLALEDYFMPPDWSEHGCVDDEDLGSATPVLINPHLMFQAGKWGTGFLIDPTAMGGVGGHLYPTPKPATYSEADVCLGNHEGAVFGSFAYAAPYVYLSCDLRGMMALKVDTGAPSFSACDEACAAPSWFSPTTQAFGAPIVAGGVVWTVTTGGTLPGGDGLYGFDALTGKLLYHSPPFLANRFSTPSEAGGQIFVGAGAQVRSFKILAAGLLRVTTSPPVPSQITVDGQVADSWGLNWVKFPPGSHTVCFSSVAGYTTPACQTAGVSAGITTQVTGTFEQRGFIQVITSPPVASTISIDGAPMDDWGLSTDIPIGSHQVCFGLVADLAPPPCQVVSVGPGITTQVTGLFTPSPGAPGQTNVGLLRVTSAPELPTQIMVDGQLADSSGLNWLELSPGTHAVCFTRVPGYTSPSCQTVSVVSGGVTNVTGTFIPGGFLQVSVSPPSATTIYVNGVPSNDWGLWTDYPTGSYQVCFGLGPSTPPCQSATVSVGDTLQVIGSS